MMEITREKIQNINAEIKSALNEIGRIYGMDIKLVGNLTYNSANFRARIEGNVLVKNDNGEIEKAINPRAESSAIFAFRMRDMVVSNGVIGQYFVTSAGKVVRVVDFKTRNSRYPVCYKVAGNEKQTYKTAVSAILRPATATEKIEGRVMA